ncbi:hypothetical protein JTB14_029515 [Gonioctena quinquepunctata]|nr:hypothetical protein JTB14_029515 [Gonioctena quinquepunctata]
MESAYRATCRRQVTKLINFATNLLNDNDTDTDEFVVMLTRLKSAKETLTMANREVTVNEQDAETEYETRLEYDDKAVTTMAKLERRIEKSKTIASIPQRIDSPGSRIYNNESHSAVVNSRPEINIGENESTPERAIDSNGNEILINKLMFFLKTEIESIERAKDINLPICASDSKIVDTSKFEKGDKNKHCTAAGLLTGVSNKCSFCNSTTHELQKCDGPQSLQERKIILKKNARCFRCTKANHTSRQCRNNFIKCNKCKGRHATSMCDPNFIKSNNSNNTSSPAQIQLNSCNPNSSTSLLTNGGFQNVWLQTACAFISNSDYFRMTDNLIRFVIDGGAQLTFIKEDISRKFNLPIIGTHKISINSFGSKKGAPARLYTLLTPTTADFCNRNVSKSFNLADARIEGIEPIEGISMLVGADNYWALVTGETEKISERLTAVNTKFGWTLHGTASIDSFDVNQNIVTLLHATMLENEDESNESIDIKKF